MLQKLLKTLEKELELLGGGKVSELVCANQGHSQVGATGIISVVITNEHQTPSSYNCRSHNQAIPLPCQETINNALPLSFIVLLSPPGLTPLTGGRGELSR